MFTSSLVEELIIACIHVDMYLVRTLVLSLATEDTVPLLSVFTR